MSIENVSTGFTITADDNGKQVTTMLIREGCDGSSTCAMEWYVAEGASPFGPGPNVHFSDEELERVYRAIKAVRKARYRQACESTPHGSCIYCRRGEHPLNH